jgi:hypothetical protein
VTAYVGDIHLDRPIAVGELVELHANLIYTGRTSMHILVTIYSTDPRRAKPVQHRSASPYSSPLIATAGPPKYPNVRGDHAGVAAASPGACPDPDAQKIEAAWPPSNTPPKALRRPLPEDGFPDPRKMIR